MTTALVLGGTGHLGSALRDQVPDGVDLIATFHRNAAAGAMPFTFGGDEDLPSVDVVIGSFPLARQLEGQSEATIDEAVERYVKRCRGARIVQLSTDAVFSGREGLRSEAHPCDSHLPYGLAQARVDAALLAHAPQSLLIRTSFIYGYAGSRWDKRLAPLIRSEAGPTKSWARNVFRSPTDVNFLAHVIWRLCDGPSSGVLNVSGERMSVFDFFDGRLSDLKLNFDAGAHDEVGDGVAYDTSLGTARMTQLTGLKAEESLTWFRNGLGAQPSP